MARKKSKKHSWLRSLLLFIVTPLTVWVLAFVIWLFWSDITELFAPGKPAAQPGGGSARESPPAKQAPEDIRDEERKKLDDILKRR